MCSTNANTAAAAAAAAVVDDTALSWLLAVQCLFSHPYPVGYRAVKRAWNHNFEMTISNEGGRPLFTVRVVCEASDVERGAVRGVTPRGVVPAFGDDVRLRRCVSTIVSPRSSHGFAFCLLSSACQVRTKDVVFKGPSPTDPWTAVCIRYGPTKRTRASGPRVRCGHTTSHVAGSRNQLSYPLSSLSLPLPPPPPNPRALPATTTTILVTCVIASGFMLDRVD